MSLCKSSNFLFKADSLARVLVSSLFFHDLFSEPLASESLTWRLFIQEARSAAVYISLTSLIQEVLDCDLVSLFLSLKNTCRVLSVYMYNYFCYHCFASTFGTMNNIL